MSFGIYSLAEFTAVLGIITFENMRADAFLTLAAAGKSFEVIKGAAGEMTRYRLFEDTDVTATITLKRSSNENQKLSALHNADVLAPGGAGVTTLLLKDPNGASLFFAPQAWIEGIPETGNSKDVGPDVSWSIRCKVPAGTIIVGGNQIS